MANRLVSVDEDNNLPSDIQQQLVGSVSDHFQELTDSAELAASQSASNALATAEDAADAEASKQAAEEAAASATAPTDEMLSTLVGTPDTQTRIALDGRYEQRQSNLRATTGDQTSRIQSFLSSSSPLGVKVLIGSFSISGTISVPANTTVDLYGAQITQVTSNTASITCAENCSVQGGVLNGVGSDYISGISPTAHGVVFNGGYARIRDTRLNNFSGASVNFIGVTDARVSSCKIVGVGALITAQDGGPCWGVLADTGTTGLTVSDCDISEVCQGVITGLTVTHISVTSTSIYNIRGQHGCYIQNAFGLNLSDLNIRGAALNGIKVQLADNSTMDSITVAITNITVSNCLGDGVIVYNSAATLAGMKKIYALTVNNISAYACNRALYLGSIRGGTVSNITARNITRVGLTFIDCVDLVVSNVVTDLTGRMGIWFCPVTGGANDNISLANVRVKTPAGEALAGSNDAILISDGTNITIDNPVIYSANTSMRYGINLEASAGTSAQQTFTLRGADIKNALTAPAIFLTPATTVKGWSNNRLTGTVVNKPTGVAALTAVP